MILIITNKQDGHIAPVVKHFKNLDWVRLNTEDIAINLNMSISPDKKDGEIKILDSNKAFRIQDVQSIWYRKPEPVFLNHFDMDKAGLEYVEAELSETLLGLYALLDNCNWINNPFRTRITHRKLLQLEVAKKVGFKIPDTIISNDEATVFSFAQKHNWDIAIKSLGAISVATHDKEESHKQFGIFTRRINKEELIAVKDKVQYLPTLYQEYISKKYELRITCVGKKIFGCKIDSQSNPISKEDMRFNIQDLKHEPYDCCMIEEKLLAYLDFFKINFGCFDIIVDENDNFVFVECNPNGQWLWIENMTGMNISKAIADLLIT